MTRACRHPRQLSPEADSCTATNVRHSITSSAPRSTPRKIAAASWSDCLWGERRSPTILSGVMTFYCEHGLPWLIDLSMRQSRLAPYRSRVVSAAELPRYLAPSLPDARRVKEDFSSSYGRCRVPFLTSLFSQANLSSESAGFHSRANFCASAICAVVIPSDNKSTNLVKSK